MSHLVRRLLLGACVAVGIAGIGTALLAQNTGPPSFMYWWSGTAWQPVSSANPLPTTGGGGGGGGAVTIADGADVTEGAKADAAYAGSGAASVVAILKGVYTGIQGIITAINASAITGFATAANQVVPFTPAAPTVSTASTVTSLILKGSATTSTGGVKYYHAENATTTSGYCILYNGTTAPSTGALTAANVLGFQLLPASGFCDWTATNIPIAASTGAVVLVSSGANPFTYTTGVITASIFGLAQ